MLVLETPLVFMSFQAVSNRCDAPVTVLHRTPCTSCATSAAVVCPRGFRKITKNPDICRNLCLMCSVRQVELSGCSHSCQEVTTVQHCCPGFWGPLCLRESPRPKKMCNGYGTCDSGNGTCVCNEGYTGSACQNCLNGNAYGDHCRSECSCVHGKCNSGPDGDGECLCQPPFSGPKCDKGNLGTVSVSFFTRCGDNTNAVCECLPGYKKTGNACIGVCSQGICDANAKCSFSGGKFQCECEEGFKGDGQHCLPINPCDTNNGGCPVESTLCELTSPGKVSSTFHSFSCRCNAQLIGDGRRCYGNLMERVLELDREGSQAGNLTGSIRFFGGSAEITRPALPLFFSYPTLSEQLSLFYQPALTVCCVFQSKRVILRTFFLFLLQNCGALLPLRGSGPLTVFVPTNTAIDKSRDGSFMYMLNEVSCHYMLSVTVDQLASMSEITTMANEILRINASDDGRVFLGDKGIPLETKDIVTSNGIIHLIDGVLVPSSIVPIMPHRCDINGSRISFVGAFLCTRCPPGSVDLFVRRVISCFQTPQCCSGFYGPDCKPCIGGFRHPCYDKGTCFDGISGNGSCKCEPAFTGVGCHLCSNPNKHGENCNEDCRCVHGVCDNRPGSMGVCRRGSCQEGFSGELCDQTPTPCNSDGVLEHCHIHAKCVYNNDQTMLVSLECVCLPGYDGDGYTCTKTNPCLQPQRGGCDVNAGCMYDAGKVNCVCMEGWTGDGRLCVEINNCLSESRGGCHENADCTVTGPGQNECSCKKGYMGDGIVCNVVNPCLSDNGGCHSLATCKLKSPGIRECVCRNEYEGDGLTCYGNMLVVRSCIYDHSCCPGYFGHDCSKCPGSVDNWCSNNGQCKDGLFGSGECLCNEGFHGTACEMCEPGRYGKDCKSECHCEHGKCLDGMEGNGQCICFKGWKGVNCAVAVVDDACGGVCDVNANCISGGSGAPPTCSCIAGYKGNGTFCKEFDPCTTNNGGCSINANCTKTLPGERSCTCKTGYIGDGVMCLEMDACLVDNGGCDKNALCMKTGPNRVACACKPGFISQGHRCLAVNPCRKNNGGCSINAVCRYLGDGERNCTCYIGYKGDGFKCAGTVNRVNLYSQGPFTVFVPHADYVANVSVCCTESHQMSAFVSQGVVYINDKTKIITSDVECSNGVIHFIDKVLFPYDLTGKADIITNVSSSYSLPEDRKKWLYSEDHRDKLQAYLKAHIITAVALPGEKSMETLFGSKLTFSCSKNLIGDILINGNNARIVARNMLFDSGIAHGIDQLLEPPSIGARCDNFTSIEIKGLCGSCDMPPRCPYGSEDSNRTSICGRHYSPYMYRRPSYHRLYPYGYGYNSYRDLVGCDRVCKKMTWAVKCCKNHFGRDCQVCPGGLEAPCGEHGDCDDGRTGTGTCKCHKGFTGTGCELCKSNHFGPNCTACNCTSNGKCNSGLDGDGSCFCQEGWTGKYCESKIEVKPICSPACDLNAVCLPENNCECVPPYGGNGINCTAPDFCSEYNGGCHEAADCLQSGINVTCSCQAGYSGDGHVCSPINRCVEEANGGCSDFAECIFTGPNERRCECLKGYVGNGIQCLEKVVPPVDRCLEDNGGCDPKATCKDLHFHMNTGGVFHLRSPEGKYKLNFSQAQEACEAEGATLATFKQLSDAQQVTFEPKLSCTYHAFMLLWRIRATVFVRSR
uniref:Stabilin 1 n=1 Tax=Cyprinus carpio carpio TaxID=630221 RepID=A0A9J7XQL0_CYPCA